MRDGCVCVGLNVHDSSLTFGKRYGACLVFRLNKEQCVVSCSCVSVFSEHRERSLCERAVSVLA